MTPVAQEAALLLGGIVITVVIGIVFVIHTSAGTAQSTGFLLRSLHRNRAGSEETTKRRGHSAWWWIKVVIFG